MESSQKKKVVGIIIIVSVFTLFFLIPQFQQLGGSTSEQISESSETPLIQARYTDFNWFSAGMVAFGEAIHLRFKFKMSLEIWNSGPSSKAIIFPDWVAEFAPLIDIDLENQTLEVFRINTVMPMFHTSTFSPGVVVKSISQEIYVNTTTELTDLPRGSYRITPNGAVYNQDTMPISIPTYGLTFTITENGSTIVYDQVPDDWGSTRESSTPIIFFGEVTLIVLIVLAISRIRAKN